MNEKNIKPVDFHEAGHVLIALLEGYRESIEHVKMTYDKRSGTEAHVRFVERPDEVGGLSAQRDFKQVAISMAGIAAELVTGEQGRYLLKAHNPSDVQTGEIYALSMCMRDIQSNAIERRFEAAIEFIQKHTPKNWHMFKVQATAWLEMTISNSKSERTSSEEYRPVYNIVKEAINYDIDLINQHREELDAIAELLSKKDFVDYSEIKETVPHLCS